MPQVVIQLINLPPMSTRYLTSNPDNKNPRYRGIFISIDYLSSAA